MNSLKSCVLFYFFFACLIAGVNHDQATSTVLDKLILNAKLQNSLDLSPRDSSDEPSVANFDFSVEHSVQLSSNNSNEISNEVRPLCFPYDSCSSSCGNGPRGPPYTCNCDSQCTFYADCCVDFETQCGNISIDQDQIKSVDTASSAKFTCELLFDSYPLFVISKCSEKWKNASYANLCAARLSSECVLSNIFMNFSLSEVSNRCESFVYSQCIDQFSLKCNQTVEPRCSAMSKNECGKISSRKCQRCDGALWPVVDSDGTLFANSYCAGCNFQNSYTALDFETLSDMFHEDLRGDNISFNPNVTYRSCFPSAVDSCSDVESGILSHLCKNVSGPVFPVRNSQHYPLPTPVYKNVYCALCNGERINDLKCAGLSANNSPAQSAMQEVVEKKVMDFVTGITGDIQGLRLYDIPAAFSMLLNFGLDGRQRVYISSEGGEAMRRHQRLCGAGYIWDPFSSICRKLHCSTEFVLVDYQCLRKETNDDDNSTHNQDIDIPDPLSDFVHLSFSAEMELLDFLQFYDQDIDEIRESIRESFSASFNIRIERIRNVNFNISLGNIKGGKATFKFLQVMDDNYPINFTFSMDLYETTAVNLTAPEPSVDNIVSMLASALSYNGFQIGINNKMSRIYQIHQTVDFLTSWCNSDVGERKEYWNSDFKVILNDNISSNFSDRINGIYINKTGQFYTKGSFIADILYQGYQFNQNLINVSGLAIVCDWKRKLNSSCARVILQKHEYSISENGSLVILNSRLKIEVDDSTFERAGNESIFVCLSSEMPAYFDEDYYMEMDIVQAYVSYVLSLVSVIAMIIVLATYAFFSNLRNLPGCNTMNLTCSLTAMQITFLLGQRTTVTGKSCKAVACVLHYEILCCFMWMNVMAYDLFKTFGNKTMLNNIRSKGKYLLRYMVYAYGTPLVIITATTLFDHFLKDSILCPQYGRNDVCWITNKYAAIMYFAFPLAVVMCINFIFYVRTILSISNVKHILHLSNEKSNHRGKSDVFLYARMALVIGLTWALAFAAAYVKQEKLTGQILTYLFIIFNTLQGVFIFFVFVCNHRVCDLYREALRKLGQICSRYSAKPSTFRPLNGLAYIIERTVSTNTIVSTISNSSSGSNSSELSTIREGD